MGCAAEVVLEYYMECGGDALSKPLEFDKIDGELTSMQNTGRIMDYEIAVTDVVIVDYHTAGDQNKNYRIESRNNGLRQFNKLYPAIQAQYRFFDDQRLFNKSRYELYVFLVSCTHISKFTAFYFAALCDEPIMPKQFGGVMQLINTSYFFRKYSNDKKESGLLAHYRKTIYTADEGLMTLFEELKLDDLVYPAALFAHLAENGYQISYKDYHAFVEYLMCGTGMEYEDFIIVHRKFVYAPLATQKLRHQVVEEPSGSDVQELDDEFRKLFY